MLLKVKDVLSVVKSIHRVISFRSSYNKKSKMDVPKIAYFHLLDGSDKFKVNFCYVNESIGVNRQFNFERRTVETVQMFLARVTTNLEKIVSKKVKKKRKKSGSDEDDDSFNVTVELSGGDNPINPETALCKDVFFSNRFPANSLVLRMIDIDYVVAINAPWIDSMTLPASIMAGFPVFANNFVTKFTDKSLSNFVWMKPSIKVISDQSSPKNIDWIVVGEGFVYTPAVVDIGFKLKLKCTPKNATETGPSFEQESSSVIEAGPGYCPFEERHLYTQQKTVNGSFRVVSYNILADVYSSTDTARDELFNYCPTYALSIDYRKQLFLKELTGYNADIICLQEVDTKVFESDLAPVLGEQGLLGVHAKKSTINEGVATFYSSSKFKLLKTQEVVLSEELLGKTYCSHILSHVDKNPALKERISGLGTTAQALILESLEKSGELLVVGNTHFYFHPDADHIRLLQGGILMAFLTDVVEQTRKENPNQAVSLVLCGDFNSVPECGIYKLMTTKTVPADCIDWKSKPEEEVVGLSLSQPLNIESACGTPKYTNYTVSFADCLDYIYFQTDRLKVDSVVPFPEDDVLREHRAIPSVVFPSDHVALIAELNWTT